MHSTYLYFIADFLLFYRGTNMVQIYNKKTANKQNQRKKQKKEKRCNLLSYTSFLMDIYRCLSILISLPQNQHPAHYRHALYYPEHRLVDLHSYQDQPVHHPEHRSGHTFQHLQPGMPYSVRPWQNLR